MKEHEEQVLIFQWAHGTKHLAGAILLYHDLELLHAIPQQARRTEAGYIWMHREGVRPGVPDINLPVPRGEYIGLWIELKAGKNKTTTDQDWWLEKLKERGHSTHVCYGANAAINTITWYLELKEKSA